MKVRIYAFRFKTNFSSGKPYCSGWSNLDTGYSRKNVNGRRRRIPHRLRGPRIVIRRRQRADQPVIRYAPARTGPIAHNVALVRQVALNLIRLDTSRKASIKTKRLLASASDEFRAALLGVAPEGKDDDDEE